MSTADRSNSTALWAIVGLLALILVAGVGGGAMYFAGQRADRAKLEQKEADAKAAEKQRKNDDIDAGILKLAREAIQRSDESRKKIIALGRSPDSTEIKEIDAFIAEQRVTSNRIVQQHPGWTVDGPSR